MIAQNFQNGGYDLRGLNYVGSFRFEGLFRLLPYLESVENIR